MAERLYLYYRVDCGLCELMVEEIAPLREELGFELELRDVDACPEWAATYGERVPVLEGARGELSHFFLDPDALRGYFASI